MSSGSAADVPASRHNNFDALRLAAALAVVIAHSWPLTGVDPSPAVLGIPLFTLAVYVFFALSGYLVSTSWASDPHPGRFLARRALRIFPALIAVVVLSVVVIGPIVTTVGVGRYFGDPETWGYLLNVSLVANYELPGVFETHPRPVVNGVLWTLGPEFLCYLGVLGVGLLPARGRIPVVAVVTVALVALQATDAVPDWTAAFRAAVFFVGGAALAALERRRRLPSWPAIPLLLLWVLGALLLPDAAVAVAWIALPPIAIVVGRARTPIVRELGRFGDVSYGSYLWGFVVQQLVIAWLGILPLPVDIPIVVGITVLVAAASWHLVERRALALKPRRPTVSG